MRRYMRMTMAVALLAAAGCAQAEGPFQEVTFTQAQEAAAKSKKLVFIDFYTTWCFPCKMLEQTTFKDAWVKKWLAEKTVALKVDAERDVKLAEKFKVEVYPTMVFLNAEGKEIERLNGYLEPDQFRSVVKDLDKGVTALERTQRELAEHPDDARVRFDFAAALMRKGRYSDAFRELVWCLDHGAEKNPTFAEVRDGALLDELMMLSQTYEPAAEELLKRRDTAEQRILDDRAQAGDVALFAKVCDFAADGKRLVAAYDAAASRGASSSSARELFDYAFPMLLEGKRYADIAKAVDLPVRLDALFAEGRAAVEQHQKASGGKDDEALAMVKARTVAKAANWYQVLLGLERLDEARTLAKRVLDFDSTADSYHALAWEGFLSGKPIEDCLEYARTALKRSPDEQKANVTDTVARIMNALGESQQAVALCKSALADATSDRDRWILETCVTELRSPTASP